MPMTPAVFGDCTMTVLESADYAAARSSAVVFDLSARGQVELTGAEAVPFLHNLCTNDIRNLPARHGCEMFLTTNKARVVGHGFAHRLLAEPPTVVLDVDPGTGPKVAAHLNHFIVSEQVEVVDRSGAVAQFHVAGPKAAAVVEKVLGQQLEPLADLQHVIHGDLRIVRHDRLLVHGFDFFVPPSEAEVLGRRLAAGGAVVATLETFNVLRVEAGIPVDTIDMDSERFVVEVGRIGQAISYTKGCYLGQEPIVMARDRGHANRAFLGLKVEGDAPLTLGAKLLQNEQEVGQVTSSVASPLVGSAIALVYLKRGSQAPGTALEVEWRRATVVQPPFRPAGDPAEVV
jgi:folate-binding protein YgfZ